MSMITLILASTCLSLVLYSRFKRRQLSTYKRYLSTNQSTKLIGFFHPYCNAGGGGERVLWTALSYMQRQQDKDHFLVYTGDDISKQEMLGKVKSRFGIELDHERIDFVQLTKRWLVEDSIYPRLTLLGQSLGSIVLAIEATWQVVPDVWIDTMGYAFTYPLIRYISRIPIISYTHYPTISTDMISRVSSRSSHLTNSTLISHSRLLTHLKLIYYRLFSTLYKFSLSRASLIYSNSTWTKNHLSSLLPSSSQITLLYPPCDTTSLISLPLTGDSTNRRRDPHKLLSLSQFRPEKLQSLQLLTLSHLFSISPQLRQTVTLTLAGSVRNERDSERVEELRELSKKLGIERQVEFRINESWESLRDVLGGSGVGLHTMQDEHFGITLVEFQAAGLITLAHKSAGPLLDILIPSSGGPTGFLAEGTKESFANELKRILELDESEQEGLRTRARENAMERFGVEVFEEGWEKGWRRVIEGKGKEKGKGE